MESFVSFEGKAIIVTGAASGIGRETAVLLNKLGAKVLLIDINEEGLKDVCKNASGVTYRNVDITDTDALKESVMSAKKELDCNFTGLVHCAGIPSVTPLRAITDEKYERVMKVNVQAGLNLAKIFASRQCYDTKQQGAIVYISSVYGIVGSAANAAYATSKAAIIGLTKSLAIELASKNIRVNCVAPGFIKTSMADSVNSMFDKQYEDKIEKMHPLGWGSAIDIANAIAFLLSDASKWTTGAVFNIDGGFTAQ